MPHLRGSYGLRRVAGDNQETAPTRPTTTGHTKPRKHPHPGHPATTPLPREGSWRPTGPNGQPKLSQTVQKNELGAGQGGKGKGGNAQTPQQNKNEPKTTTQPNKKPRPPTGGEDGLHWYRDRGRSRRREPFRPLPACQSKNRAVIRGKRHRPRAPTRRREEGRPGGHKSECPAPLIRVSR